MKKLMPQEIQVWYILPALRREFAKCLVKEHDFTQKEAAEKLGVTEAAVSQYFGSKRAKEVEFKDDVIEAIKTSCDKVVNDESTLNEEMYKLSISEDVKRAMCKAHKKHDPNVAEGCEICFKHEGEW